MATATKVEKGSPPSSVQLVEEAVHLLRQTPLATWTIYALGTCPWILGFLFFWAHTTWFAPSPASLAWSALGLVGLFALLKTAQAEFCARLLAQRLGAPMPAFTATRLVRVLTTQLRIHAWGAILLPLSLVVSVPFGWAYAFYQNVSVLGSGAETSDVAPEAWAETQRWAGQNHMGLLYISVLALAGWINLAAAFYAIPWLANRLLGIENMFGLGGWGWLNTTFLVSVSALTWLAVDPLVKAFYVLRVFYGRSQRTGDDLRVDLVSATRLRRAALAAILVVLLGGVVGNKLHAVPAAGTSATRSGLPPTAVDPRALDRSLDEVLARRDFQWRLRPPPRTAADESEEAGPIMRFLRQGLKFSKETFDWVVRLFKRLIEWLRDLVSSKNRDAEATKHRGVSAYFLRLLLYVLIGVALIAIVLLVVMMWPSRRREGLQTMSAQPVADARPDLADENVEATHLPSDGWLALAREQMAKGEWRLALRALYLASLAQLAAQGLVTLIKSKTNLDYERELRRRAPTNTTLVARFGERRREFESVWYGRAVPAEDNVRAWFDELRGGTPG